MRQGQEFPRISSMEHEGAHVKHCMDVRTDALTSETSTISEHGDYSSSSIGPKPLDDEGNKPFAQLGLMANFVLCIC